MSEQKEIEELMSSELNELKQGDSNMSSDAAATEDSKDETDKQTKEFGNALADKIDDISFVNKSPALRVAVHGMSELINTRLSTAALEICLDLIEKGVHPRALAEVVLHILDVRVKMYEKEHGPILP